MKYSYDEFLLAFWIIFYAYWLISAVSAKKNIRTNRNSLLLRIVIAVVIVALFTIPQFAQLVKVGFPYPALNALGVILCGLGVALAIWARVYLGRNWGMPMSVKENPELVSGGPYRYIRHPIYSGVLLAMLGSALVGGVVWIVALVAFGAYFVYAAGREEHLMIQEFSNQYPDYMKKSKRFIPFIY